MKFSLTLSRWHKVAQRIHAATKEREARLKAAYTETSISTWNREGVEEKAAEIARRAAQDLALVEAGAGAVAAIRAVLASRNAELGISGRLAQVEAANRCSALYRQVIEGQRADMVRPESVRHLPPDTPGQTDWLSRRSVSAITLQTADAELLEALRATLAREQARAVRTLDEIADLNREKVEVELPQEVIEIAGLAA
jgi:hypothetical protein